MRLGPSSRTIHGLLVVLLPLCVPGEARAWKPVAHMILAKRSIDQGGDPDLKSLLAANVSYVEAGATGPDVFYPTHWYYSDLAHYSSSSVLARAMIQLAQSPRQEAFAYGWRAQVVQDSVAHPWVNGFTGGPFGAPGSIPEMGPVAVVGRGGPRLPAPRSARQGGWGPTRRAAASRQQPAAVGHQQ